MSNKKTKIIAIAGTSCSGKGTIVNCYKEEFGFHHRSMRQMIAEAGNKLLGKPLDQIVTREQYRHTADALREKHGPSCLVDFILETAPKDGKPIVIESFRTVAEIDAVKGHPDFHVTTVFLDAPRDIRYQWSQKRKDLAEMHGNQFVSFEEFSKREYTEWSHIDHHDPTKMNLAKVSKMCDHTIINDKSHDDLKHHARRIAQGLLNESRI